MERFAFVILNYESTDETIACIETLLKLSYSNTCIIVVDNASEDQEYLFGSIRDRFDMHKDIYCLKSNENLGYAKGNNIGIDYAVNKLGATYVCVINPDVIIDNMDFVEKSMALFQKYNYAILGPVIWHGNKNGNPLMGYHESVARCLYFVFDNWRIYIVKKWNLRRFNLIRYLKRDVEPYNCSGESIKKEGETHFLNASEGEQLSGACMVFSPLFLRNFNGFCDKTFLYCEENIIAFILYKLGYTLLYTSELAVIHKGGMSLQNIEKDNTRIKMIMAKEGARSCFAEARIFSKKHSKSYLKRCLNAQVSDYYEV